MRGPHKGCRPFEPFRMEWSERHPVARSIAGGSTWFVAWRSQASTPLHRLTRLTGLSIDRLAEIERGGHLTRSELEALARAWQDDIATVERSLPNPSPLID